MKNIYNVIPVLTLVLLMVFSSCSQDGKSDAAKQLGIITGFAEMVAADVKPLALSEPMSSADLDKLIPEITAIADRYGIGMYREADLIKTDLFADVDLNGKEVLLLYKGTTLERYQELKYKALQQDIDREEIARSFGRLLGYPNHYINKLLSASAEYRTLADFGINATNVFLYYEDLSAATAFYSETLGLELVADYGFAKTIRIAPDSYLILVDEGIGMHSAEEPKTVAIALLTDRLADWYAYLQAQNITIKYTYKPRQNNAHDGFVAIDPEGYLLEFEEFKAHPENERLMPMLRKELVLKTDAEAAPDTGFYGAITWLYYNDMLAAQAFYEEQMGLQLVVDQGWAKIYAASETGYIGLVDACRGMHDFAEEKAVNVSFFLQDVDGWYAYAKGDGSFRLRGDTMEIDPEGRYKAFVGYDPGGYFLEFDQFLPHTANEKLLQLLNQ